MTKKITKLMLNGQEYEIREYQGGGGGGRQPGPNTLAYYPLNSTSTVSDMSGNSNDLLNNGNVTFGTHRGVDCAYFDNNRYGLQSPSLYNENNITELTICTWFYANGAPDDTDGKVWNTDGHNCLGLANWLGGYYWSDFHGGTINTSVNTTGEWILATLTYDGTSFTLTMLGDNVNFSQTESVSSSAIGTAYTIGDSPLLSRMFKGGISNFIVEDRARTQQEIEDYYNQTKSLYGIS